MISLRARAALVAVLAALVGAAAATHAVNGPIRRLANYHPDTRDPLWHNPATDSRAIRRAAAILPDDATYYVQAPADLRISLDMTAATHLFFTPALRVAD